MKTLYIAGPYSSATPAGVEANVAASIDAYNAALDMGCDPYLPHFSHYAHGRQPRHYEDWMALDLRWLARCDAILRLPGHSPGADREVAHATELGLPVLYSLRQVERWANSSEVA